jgi:hypothetical protein
VLGTGELGSFAYEIQVSLVGLSYDRATGEDMSRTERGGIMNVEDSGWRIGIRWMKKWYVGRSFRIGPSILAEVWFGLLP